MNLLLFQGAVVCIERVAIIPGKAFGTDDYVRISYACHEDDFLEGIDRLERYIKKYL